jgi:NAD(P)-dependent dehydrogenase (short-subunit alcohol dehydrogenase family)
VNAGDARALADQVVAVTGASRGTGLAMSRALAGAGAQVAMLARPSAHLKQAAESVPGALAVPIELSDPGSVRAAFASLAAAFGRLDALVNNAATASAHPIEECTDEEVQHQIGTNLLGPIYCIRAAVPMLREAGGGTIVNVSSESASDPFPHLLVYGASKAGLDALTRGLLGEVRRDNIRVTLLVSGLTRTGGFSARWDPARRDAARAAWEQGGFLRRVAGSEPQEPEDVADALLFVLTRPARTMVDVVWCRAAR